MDVFDLKDSKGRPAKYSVLQYPWGGPTINKRLGPSYMELGHAIMAKAAEITQKAGASIANVDVRPTDVLAARIAAEEPKLRAKLGIPDVGLGTEDDEAEDNTPGPLTALFSLLTFNPAAVSGGAGMMLGGAIRDLMLWMQTARFNDIPLLDCVFCVTDREGYPGDPHSDDQSIREVCVGEDDGRRVAYYRNRGELYGALAAVVGVYWREDLAVPFDGVMQLWRNKTASSQGSDDISDN